MLFDRCALPVGTEPQGPDSGGHGRGPDRAGHRAAGRQH
jgi:hypothetical protein